MNQTSIVMLVFKHNYSFESLALLMASWQSVDKSISILTRSVLQSETRYWNRPDHKQVRGQSKESKA